MEIWSVNFIHLLDYIHDIIYGRRFDSCQRAYSCIILKCPWLWSNEYIKFRLYIIKTLPRLVISSVDVQKPDIFRY
jgi:hypothetical protein